MDEELCHSIWTWYRENDYWEVRKTVTIPAQQAEPDQLPDPLKGFKAVPPFVTGIELDLNESYLYVSCWGTGEMHQYDVNDPFKPELTDRIEPGIGLRAATRTDRSFARSGSFGRYMVAPKRTLFRRQRLHGTLRSCPP